MNKYQEALNELSNIVFDESSDGYNEPRTLGQFFFNDFDHLQELVDKTVPCKPIYDKYYSYDFKCKCGGHVGGYEDFCHNCGQALDWNEDDE